MVRETTVARDEEEKGRTGEEARGPGAEQATSPPQLRTLSMSELDDVAPDSQSEGRRTPGRSRTGRTAALPSPHPQRRPRNHNA